MKLGDLILNTLAGRKNPNRVSLFIKTDRLYIVTINRDGSYSKFYREGQTRDNFLKVVGHVDLTPWDDAIKHDSEPTTPEPTL